MTLLLVLLSVVCAVVPMVVFLVVVWWLDRYDREPAWLLLATFGWGALGGVLLALVGSAVLTLPLLALDDAGVVEAVQAVFIAPLVEEPAKALVLLAVARSRHFDNTTDGFVYGAATGLGFAMTENFMYFSGAAVEGDVGAWFAVVVVRTLYSALMHASASSVVGAALGYARFRGCLVQAFVLPLAMLVAIGIHGLWNGLLTAGGAAEGAGALIALDFLIFPLEFATLFVVLQLSLRSEKATIRRELREEADGGLIPALHAEIVSSTFKRAGRAWVPKGVDHHAYVRALTTLAFRKAQARHAGPRSVHAHDVHGLREEIRRLLGRHDAS